MLANVMEPWTTPETTYTQEYEPLYSVLQVVYQPSR